MSDPQPDPRHRPQRGPIAELARLFLVQLAAVIGIATAIVVVVALVGPDRSGDVTAVAPGSSPTSDAATTPPAGKATTPEKSTPEKSTPEQSQAAPPTTEAPSSGAAGPVKVDVLNQSAPSGMADDVAKRLKKAGWKIGRVDDFRGNVSTTTVYWLDPQQRRQARQVSRFLGGVRVQEGFSTLVDGRVSVVLVGKR